VGIHLPHTGNFFGRVAHGGRSRLLSAAGAGGIVAKVVCFD
jgi:hypothetical protein